MALSLNDVEKTSRFNTYPSRIVEKLYEFTIYPHQCTALLQLQNWYNDGNFRIGLVVIPTDGGKSGIAVLAPYILNTTCVLVITPSLQITNQLAAAFGREPRKSFYVKHDVVTENAADKFVEAPRLINQGREIGELTGG